MRCRGMQGDAHRLAHRVRMQPHRERIRIAREAQDASAAAALVAAPAPAGAPDAGGAAEDWLPIDAGPAVPSPSEDGDAFMEDIEAIMDAMSPRSAGSSG